MDRREAATLLGMPRKEIRSVDENWITATDGSMHEVPTGPVDHWVRSNPKENPPKYHPEYADVETDEDDDEDEPVDADPYPAAGTAQEILDWVNRGEDPQSRARTARAAEEAKGVSARKSLIAALEKLAA